MADCRILKSEAIIRIFWISFYLSFAVEMMDTGDAFAGYVLLKGHSAVHDTVRILVSRQKLCSKLRGLRNISGSDPELGTGEYWRAL